MHNLSGGERKLLHIRGLLIIARGIKIEGLKEPPGLMFNDLYAIQSQLNETFRDVRSTDTHPT